VLTRLLRSVKNLGLKFDLVKINEASNSMRPMTGPGIASSKICWRASPNSCNAKMIKIAINKRVSLHL